MSKYFEVSFAVALFLSGVGKGHGSCAKVAFVACLVESPFDVLFELMLVCSCSRLVKVVVVDVTAGGSLTISLKFVAAAPTIVVAEVVVVVVVAAAAASSESFVERLLLTTR